MSYYNSILYHNQILFTLFRKKICYKRQSRLWHLFFPANFVKYLGTSFNRTNSVTAFGHERRKEIYYLLLIFTSKNTYPQSFLI